MKRLMVLCLTLFTINAYAQEIYVDKTYKKKYNIYDKGNIYYMEKKSSDLYKVYPKSTPNDEVSYPDYIIVKDPYGGDPYDD